MTTFTTTHASLFDVDGISCNQSWDPRPILQAAQVILARDIDTGDEAIVFGRESDLAWDAEVVVIELDVMQRWEMAELLQVVTSLRGKHTFQIEDFKNHRRYR